MKWSKLLSLGQTKLEAGETKDAIKYFKKALVIAQKNGSEEEEGISLLSIGVAYNTLENYHDAVHFFERGLEAVRESDDDGLEWRMCTGIGYAYFNLGNSDQSLKYHKKAFNIALKLNKQELIAESYNNLGIDFMILNDFKNSIKCAKKAIDLYKQMKDQNGLENCYGILSQSYKFHGKYHDAVRFMEESLKIIVSIGNKEKEANACFSMGDAYFLMKDTGKAVELYEKGVRIGSEINNKSLQADWHMRAGHILLLVHNYQEAIHNYNTCLEISEAIGNKQLQALAISYIGKCFQKLEEIEKAKIHLNKSLAITMEINWKGLEANIYHDMATCCMSEQVPDFKSAISLLEKCIDIASGIEDKKMEMRACSLLGRVYYILHEDNQEQQTCLDNNLSKSEEYLKKALDGFDFLLTHLEHREQSKISLFDDFVSTYKLLTSILLKTKKPLEALIVSDSARARALGDCLEFKYVKIGKDFLSALSTSKSLTQDNIQAVHFRDVFTTLHYYCLSKSLVVWVLAKDSMEVQETEKKQFDCAIRSLTEGRKDENSMNGLFADTVARAYDMMKIEESVTCENRSLDDLIASNDPVSDKTMSREGGEREEVDQESHPLKELYDCLVEPVLKHVQHDDVVIVPDGLMYRVPFAALMDPNTGKYLSDIKRIRLVPSIAVLNVLQNCPLEHHSHEGALLVGDPSVGEVMFRGQNREFKSLHSAGVEVSALSRILNSTVLTGEQATKEAVLEKMREGSAVIHIAAHGSSEYGEILLAPNRSPERQGIPEEDDYLLTLNELQEIGIKAQLVVLSCCYSGRGKIRAEGMIGMSRAFLAAGARAVVASLWAINDDVTLSFMMSFYGYLTRGESACVSLHKAMRDIREEGYSDPKYWAPFFLIGDDIVLNLKP